MRMVSASKIALSLCIFSVSFAVHALTVDNQKDLLATYGMSMYPRSPEWLKTTKIAILDNGFAGFAPNGGSLPDSAVVVEGPKNPMAPTDHGFGMGVISWALTDNSPTGPQYFLINANGFSNFKAAVDYVIAHDIQIVVYSQNWLYGSNFDGTGLFEPLIKKATDHGVIWLQAAGNYRNQVFNRAVLPLNPTTHYVPLPDAGDTLRFENELDDNEISITLSWNDFTADENYATAKDLDLFVYNDLGTLVDQGVLQQQGKTPPADGSASKLSALARESLSLHLKRGVYSIKVKASSDNFSVTDKLRVYVTSNQVGSVRLNHASSSDEVAAPADSPNVITVGDCSEVSSRGGSVAKPDIVMPVSMAQLSNGNPTGGSSNAAAMLSGIVSVLRATELNLSAANLRTYFATLRPDPNAGKNSCETTPVWRTPSPDVLRRLVRNSL